MRIVMMLAVLAFIIIVAVCLWETGKYFNTLPEKDKGKMVVAWDLVILFFTLVALIMRFVRF